MLHKPVLVPEGDVTSLGSAIFAFLAAGAFASVEEAQDALCPNYRVIEPQPDEAGIYAEIYPHFQQVYAALGRPQAPAAPLGGVLPALLDRRTPPRRFVELCKHFVTVLLLSCNVIFTSAG